MEEQDFESMKRKALKQLRSGKSLTGKDGAFGPLLKQFLESALEAEMGAHLDESEREKGNKRNGHKSKTVKSSVGEFDISTPQDRHSNFDPKIVRKRERILADSLEERILGLYSLGMSYADISAHLFEMYDTQISKSVLSEITDRIYPEVRAWQSRPLPSMYVTVFLDAMRCKVRHEGHVRNRVVYNVMGIDKDGQKEILGMYMAESEGAKFWMQVLTDIQNRGVEDLLIVCTDNLSGFEEAIHSIYPDAINQLCIVHQIRNSIKYVVSKDMKLFAKELKTIYTADTRDAAAMALDELDEKWGGKYPIVIDSWRNNWDRLTAYFDFAKPIRKLIYTTNAVEGYHRQLRKVTKTKGAFPSDDALIKLLYLVQRRVTKKWTSPLHNWAQAIQQLSIKFGDRLVLDIN